MPVWLIGAIVNVGVWLGKKLIDNWIARKSKNGAARIGQGTKKAAAVCRGYFCSIRERWAKGRREMGDRIDNREHRKNHGE